MRDRCAVTSAATATWRNVDVVDVQLLAIGHRNRNALLLQMRIDLLWKKGVLSTKGIVSLISISRLPSLFFGSLFFFVVLAVKSHSLPSRCFQRIRPVGQLGLLDSGNVDIVAVEESKQFSDFVADSGRVPLHQSKTVSGCWCRDWYMVYFDIAGRSRSCSAGIGRLVIKKAI